MRINVNHLIGAGCVWAITTCLAVSPYAATASPAKCEAGAPTAASYKWDFQKEADETFANIQADIEQARYHASTLQSYKGELSWDSHATQLMALRSEINDVGSKVCRLEAIRSALPDWQKATIDRIVSTTRLMADSAQDAIVFGNTHRSTLWLPTYQHYVDNLYNQSTQLDNSVQEAVEYAHVSKESQDLRKDLGVKAVGGE